MRTPDFHPSSAAAAARSGQVQRRLAAEPGMAGHAAAQLQASPRLVAQRRQLAAAFGSAWGAPVQRQGGLEEELPVQGKWKGPGETTRSGVAQRVGDEEEPLQGRFSQAQRHPEPQPNQTGMPDSLKSGIESLSGLDMSGVRVHRNSSEPAQLNALAYAQGNDIHLAPGQDHHLPHEAWHVVQQRQGRVQATTQLQGVGINDDASLEGEADVMGARAQDAGRS